MEHWRQGVSHDNPDLHYWDVMGRTPVKVTITGHHMKESAGGERMMFIAFQGKKKELGLNVTNGLTIEAWHGHNPDGWIGKEITLRVAKCKGELCLRVQKPQGYTYPRNVPPYQYVDSPKPSPTPSEQPPTPEAGP